MLKKILVLAAAMLACTDTPVDLTGPPKPVPTKGTLEFATVPANVPGAMCTGESASGTTIVGPLAPKTVSDSLSPMRVFGKCTAPDYKPGEGVPVQVEAGRHVVSVVPMEKVVVPPPLVTTADVWVTSNVPTAKVVSMTRYAPNGASTTDVLNDGMPKKYVGLKADGALYVWMVVADGYESKPVSWAPLPGVPHTLQANLKKLPPAPPTEPTKGNLYVASSPLGKPAKVFAVATNGTETLIASVVTDTTLVGLNPGQIRTEVTDPTGEYQPCDGFAFVTAGATAQAVCTLQKKPVVPPVIPQYCEAVVRFGSWKYVVPVGGEINLLRTHTGIDPGLVGPVAVALHFISLRTEKTDRFVISRRNTNTGAVIDETTVSADPAGVNGLGWVNMGSFATWDSVYGIVAVHGSRYISNPPLPWNIGEIEGMTLTGRRRC